VIKAVHALRSHAFIKHIAIPTLPNRCRPIIYRIQPTRILALEKIMKPIPDKRLEFVNAEYNSAAGIIKSSWKYEGDQWIWDFAIPEGAVALVTIIVRLLLILI